MPVDSPRFFMKNWLGMVYAVCAAGQLKARDGLLTR